MDIKEWGHNLIGEVHEKWSQLKDISPLFDSGYRVFYSPITKTPQLMIIGFNPGGGEESFDIKSARAIPSTHDYYSDDYPLANKMRLLFEKINREDLLKTSVKLNLIFFRSNNMSQWNELEPSVRKDAESFCTQKTVEIIKTLRPQFILAEGIETFAQLKKALKINHEDTSFTSKGRSLFISTNFDGGRLFGIIHPSGARVSNEEWESIALALEKALN